MAQLIPKATATVNQASTLTLLIDTTGTYSATEVFDANGNLVSGPNGYGAPNRAVADNIVTEIESTGPDGSVGTTLILDNTTLPTSDWIPKNALSRYLSPSQIGIGGTEFPIGLIKFTYRPFFTTPSGGLVGVTNGSNIVTRQSAQDFTVDLADTNIIRLADGLKYTVATKTTSILTLTAAYAGTTSLVSTLYIGYEAFIAAIIDKPFKDCFLPRYINNRADACDKSVYSTLSKFFYQWNQVYALHATPNFDAANDLLISLNKECGCLSSTSDLAGCSSCL